MWCKTKINMKLVSDKTKDKKILLWLSKSSLIDALDWASNQSCYLRSQSDQAKGLIISDKSSRDVGTKTSISILVFLHFSISTVTLYGLLQVDPLDLAQYKLVRHLGQKGRSKLHPAFQIALSLWKWNKTILKKNIFQKCDINSHFLN